MIPLLFEDHCRDLARQESSIIVDAMSAVLKETGIPHDKEYLKEWMGYTCFWNNPNKVYVNRNTYGDRISLENHYKEWTEPDNSIVYGSLRLCVIGHYVYHVDTVIPIETQFTPIDEKTLSVMQGRLKYKIRQTLDP